MKKIGFLKLNNSKGFTLVEITVAVAIFIILITIFTNFFISAVKSQKKSLTSQELINSVSYNLEYMTRAMRMAKKDITGKCISQNHNFESTRGGEGIKFLNYQGDCQEFYFENNRLWEKRDGGLPYNLALTPKHLEITSFSFGGNEIGNETWIDESSGRQPIVYIFFEINELRVQTAVSQRNLNI